MNEPKFDVNQAVHCVSHEMSPVKYGALGYVVAAPDKEFTVGDWRQYYVYSVYFEHQWLVRHVREDMLVACTGKHACFPPG